MTDYMKKPLATYLDDAASDKPAPGGGSVTALVGAISTTMASMAANFTVGRQKYADVQDRIAASLERMATARTRFADLLHRDMTAYEGVLAAYRLPKGNEIEKAARGDAIQQALAKSMAVPMDVCRTAVEVLEAAEDLAGICNANLLSDVAVAAVLAEATLEAGRINVEVNLSGMSDAQLVDATRCDLDGMQQTAARLKADCLAAIKKRQG